VAVLLELTADLEQVRLRVLHEHEGTRADTSNLPAQLGADRAPGAGDEHDLVGEVRAHAIDLHAHRLAPEDVLHAHLAHLAHEVHATGEQLEHGGQRADRNAALAAGGDHLLAQLARRRWDGDDHVVGLGVVEHARQLVRGADHLEPGDPHAALAGVVVHEADRHVAELGVASHLPRDGLAAVAGPDHEHLAGALLRDAAAALVEHPHEEAAARDQRERDQEVGGDHATRRIGVEVARREIRRQEEQRDGEDERGDDGRLHDRLEVLLVHEAPELVVEPEESEDRELPEDDEADGVLEQLVVALGHAGVEAQHVGEPVRQGDEAGVDGHLHRAAEVHG
jgi:hypothetical protein